MKHLKKAALALACASILCMGLSGCGGDKKADAPKGNAGNDKVLTVYTARSESLNNLVIPAFECDCGRDRPAGKESRFRKG